MVGSPLGRFQPQAEQVNSYFGLSVDLDFTAYAPQPLSESQRIDDPAGGIEAVSALMMYSSIDAP